MKKLLIPALIVIAAAGCGKPNEYGNDFASVAVINGASGTTTTFNVLVDGVSQTGTAVVFRGASAYLNVAPGDRRLQFRSNNPAITTDFAAISPANFTANTASTIVVYDTLTTGGTSLRTLRLSDSLVATPAGTVRFRFLPLAPNAPAVDVTYLRTNVTPNDSVTVTGFPYVGNTPSVATIQKIQRFVTLPGGTYTIKQKLAGTQTVYNSATFSPALGGVFRGMYTFFTTGTAQSQAFALGVMRNFP